MQVMLNKIAFNSSIDEEFHHNLIKLSVELKKIKKENFDGIMG